MKKPPAASPADPPHPHSSGDDTTISVVVPSYNHAPYVEKTLRSLFRQTLQPTRLLVIDDGSRDDSVRIIERVLKDCPFPCELIARENRGLCATLNQSFTRTGSSTYFAYLGSDDLWLPQFLRARVALLESRPRAVLAYGNAYSIDGEDRIIDCTTDWASYVDGDVRQMLLEILAPLSPTVLYRRAALARQLWNEETGLEDYELYLHLSASGEFAFDPQILSAWRQHGYNTSRDLELMRRERLAAQRRASISLGLGARELAQFQALAGFRSAQEFMRRGEKMKAVKLTLQNLDGVPGLREVSKMFIGLLTPHRVLSSRRRRRHERAGQRYGSLPL